MLKEQTEINRRHDLCLLELKHARCKKTLHAKTLEGPQNLEGSRSLK